jgi:hypothetical protein
VRRERDILESAIASIAERAEDVSRLVDEANAVGHDGLTLRAKMLRLELLHVKADLERELGTWALHCRACSREVHWVAGLGVRAGHWAHAEPAPHGEPVVWGGAQMPITRS